jgi:sortase A
MAFPGPTLKACWKPIHWMDYALRCAGAICLVFFAGYYFLALWRSHRALDAFSEQQEIRAGESAVNVDFTLWSPGRIKAYRRSLQLEVEAPIAVLEIEKIHLRVPVFAGSDDLSLDRGAGWIEGTARPGTRGNVAIAGHRDGFFRPLKDLREGDAINLETLKRTDSYVIDRMEIVNPTDVRVLEPTQEPRITLVTCYPFYHVGSAPLRYVVEARGSATGLLAKSSDRTPRQDVR